MATDTTDQREMVAGAARRAITTPRYVIGVIAVVSLAFLPTQVDTIFVTKLTSALFFAMFVISWDFVSGYTNQVSFGHTFFFAIGGYSSAVLNLNYGIDPVIAVPIGAALAGVGGLLLALPAIRVRGHYLALLTLMAPLILQRLFNVFSDTFGGETGLPQPENLISGADYVATLEINYYLAYGLFVVILAFSFLVTRSDIGRVFTAIREDEEAVAAAGINTTKFKMFAFVTSAIIGGFAGAALVHTPVGSASPSQLLALGVIIDILIVSIFGGLGTIVGPALGGISLFMLRDYLGNLEQSIPLVDVTVAQANLLIFFTLTLVLLFVLPGGLLPWGVRQGRKLMTVLPGDRSTAVPDGGRTPLERHIERFRRDSNERESTNSTDEERDNR